MRPKFQRTRTTGAALLAAVALSTTMPAVAVAAPSITPETAGEKRDAIRGAAEKHEKKEEWSEMADALETNAKLLGDPVTLMESAEARLKYADKERSVEACQQAIETSTIALDILHFYDQVSSGGTSSRWLVIDPEMASSLVGDAEAQIAKAEALIEEIENDDVAAEDGGAVAAGPGGDKKPKKEKKKRERGKAKPGTVFIAVGSAVSALGLAGIGVGVAGLVSGNSKQDEVEKLTGPDKQDQVDKLDEEGARANKMGIVGMAVGGGVLLVGVALVVVGAIKRKKGGDPGSTARINVSPLLGRTNGFALQGRF